MVYKISLTRGVATILLGFLGIIPFVTIASSVAGSGQQEASAYGEYNIPNITLPSFASSSTDNPIQIPTVQVPKVGVPDINAFNLLKFFNLRTPDLQKGIQVFTGLVIQISIQVLVVVGQILGAVSGIIKN